MNRRDFLLTTGAAPLAALGVNAFAAANEQPLRVALIGCGWYGKTDLFHLMQVAPVEVVALCDVDASMVAAAAELVAARQPSKAKPPVYGDYRKLLAEHKPEIALIATPDHWHALPMIEACRNGADVYVQKPISVDVVEGQAMLAAARKYGRTVQVGLQRRNTPHLLEARDRIIREGKLGTVGYVDIHSYFGGIGDYPPSMVAAGAPRLGKLRRPLRRGWTITRGFIRVVGGTSARSATGRSATCAFISSTRCGTSSAWAGRSG